ncbi:hypothetical protein HDU84_003347 [Entophlyctis sp. JEL0112]|nr:hypothetical protein HDU84_003347 [Entophlyctis sp. JEL0112]
MKPISTEALPEEANLVPLAAADKDPEVVPDKAPASKLTVGQLRKSLPPHVFEKSLLQSLWYFFLDFSVIFTCFWSYDDDMSWPAYFVYANGDVSVFSKLFRFVANRTTVLGMFMWFNSIFGHISHGFLLVPFWPWAKSHSVHHAFHQHKNKDKSHTWYDREEEGVEVIALKSQPFLIPFMYFFVYLLAGYPDGSHFNPFSNLFATAREAVMCAVSTVVCVAYFAGFLLLWGWEKFVWIYGVPWLVYNFWLYKVTYLQHHGEGTVVYNEETWDFLTGCLQTIDRVYDTNTGALDSIMIVRPQLGASYKLVKGFPFMELVRHHWYSARPYLLKRNNYWEFVSQDVYSAEKAAEAVQSETFVGTETSEKRG